jgi:hypothetical protein
MSRENSYSAFAGNRCIASGPLPALLRETKAHLDRASDPRVLIFEDQTGRQVEFDFSGSLSEVLARTEPGAPARPGPGRPKLGVVSREVSLLPRHWEWLEAEPQGISATLRRLVDEARKKNPGEQRARQAREAVSHFLTAMAGNFEHFEEATRALFAKDDARFATLIADWPEDIRRYALTRLEQAAGADPE